jgi:excisionase family DNA binding protein
MDTKTNTILKPAEVTREFWTLAEVAQRLGVHTFTVRRLCWSGKLHSTRIGSLLRISEAELQRYLSEQTASAPSARAGATPGGNVA